VAESGRCEWGAPLPDQGSMPVIFDGLVLWNSPDGEIDLEGTQISPACRLQRRWLEDREGMLRNYQSKGVARLRALRGAGWKQKPVDSKAHSERMKRWWAERKGRA
jgi:hypothetical protein